MAFGEDHAAVAVRQESTLTLELFTPEASCLDESGKAGNLTSGSEYVVFSPAELEEFTIGNFSVRRGSIEGDENKFLIVFPSLDSMKQSITAVRKTE